MPAAPVRCRCGRRCRRVWAIAQQGGSLLDRAGGRPAGRAGPGRRSSGSSGEWAGCPSCSPTTSSGAGGWIEVRRHRRAGSSAPPTAGRCSPARRPQPRLVEADAVVVAVPPPAAARLLAPRRSRRRRRARRGRDGLGRRHHPRRPALRGRRLAGLGLPRPAGRRPGHQGVARSARPSGGGWPRRATTRHTCGRRSGERGRRRRSSGTTPTSSSLAAREIAEAVGVRAAHARRQPRPAVGWRAAAVHRRARRPGRAGARRRRRGARDRGRGCGLRRGRASRPSSRRRTAAAEATTTHLEGLGGPARENERHEHPHRSSRPEQAQPRPDARDQRDDPLHDVVGVRGDRAAGRRTTGRR